MEGNKEEKYFLWSDAWVFTALYFTHKNEDMFELPKIIGACDALNHCIVDVRELQTAFLKFVERGIIKIIDKKIVFTDIGKNIIENVEKVHGGLFSRVDITLKKLNSNRIKLPYIESVNDFQFISDENFKIAYIKYKTVNNLKER